MIVVRDIFQAKYGKGGELVALFKEARDSWTAHYANRILTDASGQFFTVVTETEYPSMAEWEGQVAQVFEQPDFSDWFDRMTPLIDSGRREFYNLET